MSEARKRTHKDERQRGGDEHGRSNKLLSSSPTGLCCCCLLLVEPVNGVVVSEMMCEWLTVVGGWHVPTGDDDGNGEDERTSKRAGEGRHER